METGVEVVKRVLSEVNQAPYVETLAREGHLGSKPKWYVTCLDGDYYRRIAHAITAWSDDRGEISVESVHLGSPTSWAEEEYGEKGAVQVMDIDYRRLSLAQVQARLKSFPRLYGRIQTYRRAAEGISHKAGIPIEMVFDARANMGWFLFRAQIRPKTGALEEELLKAVTAMKVVYDLTEGAHRRELLKSAGDA